jgi:hypothetical protein
MFSEMFPESHVPHRNTVWQLTDEFRENGSVADAPRSDSPRLLTEDKVLEICDRIIRTKSQKRP